MEQVASFRCWIALCRRFQMKTGRVLDGSVSLRNLVTQSIPFYMTVKWFFCDDRIL